jgi:hypothetical protein
VVVASVVEGGEQIVGFSHANGKGLVDAQVAAAADVGSEGCRGVGIGGRLSGDQ